MVSAVVDRSAAELAEANKPRRTASGTHRVARLPESPAAATSQAWRRTLIWTLSGIVVTVLVVRQPWKTLSSETVALGDHAIKARLVQVDQPVPATTSNVVLPATLRPWQTTTLIARVSGYLGAWHHDLGAKVKAGDVLAEIETPEMDQELAQGEALAREAEAAALQAKAEREEAQADLKTAEAQLARVQADTELAKSLLVRREKLVANRTVTQEEYDTFARQVEARTADVAAARSDVVRRRTNLNTRTAIIAAREATANSRQANVERLKELQIFKRIVAPFDGVVTRRTAEVGMLVTAGKEALFTVEDMSRLRVQVQVPQTYSVQTSPGVTATVSLPESSLPAVKGTITRISQSVDSANRTMLAEIELENGSHRFQPGSYAQVTIDAPTSSSWTVAANTLSMRVDGPHVALVNDKNEIEMKPVTLGRDLGTRVVVTEGIRGGERLVVNPGDDLTSGLRVEIAPVQGTAKEVAQR